MNQFLDWLNSLHETISFTMEGIAQSVNFLDTTVFCNSENRLNVKPFVKLTDRNTYLHYRSFHTRQLRNNIPYRQFLCIKCNATNQKDFLTHSKRLGRQFLVRGHPFDIVVDEESRAIARDRKTLFKRDHAEQVRFHWALDYSPRALAIARIIFKNWHLISDLRGVNYRPRLSFKAPNL